MAARVDSVVDTFLKVRERLKSEGYEVEGLHVELTNADHEVFGNDTTKEGFYEPCISLQVSLGQNKDSKEHLKKLAQELRSMTKVLDSKTVETVRGSLEGVSKTVEIISERIK